MTLGTTIILVLSRATEQPRFPRLAKLASPWNGRVHARVAGLAESSLPSAMDDCSSFDLWSPPGLRPRHGGFGLGLSQLETTIYVFSSSAQGKLCSVKSQIHGGLH